MSLNKVDIFIDVPCWANEEGFWISHIFQDASNRLLNIVRYVSLKYINVFVELSHVKIVLEWIVYCFDFLSQSYYSEVLCFELCDNLNHWSIDLGQVLVSCEVAENKDFFERENKLANRLREVVVSLQPVVRKYVAVKVFVDVDQLFVERDVLVVDCDVRFQEIIEWLIIKLLCMCSFECFSYWVVWIFKLIYVFWRIDRNIRFFLLSLDFKLWYVSIY